MGAMLRSCSASKAQGAHRFTYLSPMSSSRLVVGVKGNIPAIPSLLGRVATEPLTQTLRISRDVRGFAAAIVPRVVRIARQHALFDKRDHSVAFIMKYDV
jgi:hypothetical protein